MIKANVGGATVTALPDTRSKFERLNRMSLYRLLRYNGIEARDTMPKTKLVQMAELEEEKLVIMREDGQYAYKNASVFIDPVNGQVHIVRDLAKEEAQDAAKAEKKAKAAKDEDEEKPAEKTEVKK